MNQGYLFSLPGFYGCIRGKPLGIWAVGECSFHGGLEWEGVKNDLDFPTLLLCDICS